MHCSRIDRLKCQVDWYIIFEHQQVNLPKSTILILIGFLSVLDILLPIINNNNGNWIY